MTIEYVHDSDSSTPHMLLVTTPMGAYEYLTRLTDSIEDQTSRDILLDSFKSNLWSKLVHEQTKILEHCRILDVSGFIEILDFNQNQVGVAFVSKDTAMLVKLSYDSN